MSMFVLKKASFLFQSTSGEPAIHGVRTPRPCWPGWLCRFPFSGLTQRTGIQGTLQTWRAGKSSIEFDAALSFKCSFRWGISWPATEGKWGMDGYGTSMNFLDSCWIFGPPCMTCTDGILWVQAFLHVRKVPGKIRELAFYGNCIPEVESSWIILLFQVGSFQRVDLRAKLWMGSSLISGSVANSAQTSRVVFSRVRNGAEQEAKAEAKKGEKGGDQPHN